VTTDRLGQDAPWWQPGEPGVQNAVRSATGAAASAASTGCANDFVAWFQTVDAGGRGGTGVVLPHEHVFTDLRAPAPGLRPAEPEDVVRVMIRPGRGEEQGVRLLIECPGIGWDATSGDPATGPGIGLALVIPTGVLWAGQLRPGGACADDGRRAHGIVRS